MKHTLSNFFKFLLILTTLSFFPALCNASSQNPYDQIIFFGDSLTDNGNLYKFDLGIMPKSPPYFQGRFSNGTTWADKVSEYLGAKTAIKTANYAVGGETTIFHDPVEGFLPYTLTSSTDDYLFRNSFYDKSHSLFIIWIGANDYLPQKNLDEKLVDNVISAISNNIEKLIQNHGMNFLIVNLPDLSLTPRGRTIETSKILAQLSALHNEKLAMAVSDLQNKHINVNISLYDINDVFNKLIENPDVFNKKYHVNITNTTTGCWTGGYTLQQLQNQKSSIKAELDQQIKYNLLAKNIDTTALADHITATPDLAEAYAVSKSYANGGTACATPNEYLFWDSVHPSDVTHQLLAQGFIKYIDEHFIRG